MNEIDPEKEALLNSLKEEYNTILQKNATFNSLPISIKKSN